MIEDELRSRAREENRSAEEHRRASKSIADIDRSKYLIDLDTNRDTEIQLKGGLSRLASVIGKPLCADQLTSKLEMIPFAKFCVNYNLGELLPNSIKVVALDHVTVEKYNDVVVSYLNKPQIYGGCNSLGHPTVACPKAKRI
ncbi:hypothetical protein POM88_026975 [Heracleum sosnowskyi]|uniref:Uncharacterized protein n=1 Tax=Heracleum sosnowskyi TaxID=360622 RepID=A0AAD8I833_9APIA|nr:hypothetical protein POM88_026975 [Heracleum sosnowskyi]